VSVSVCVSVSLSVSVAVSMSVYVSVSVSVSVCQLSAYHLHVASRSGHIISTATARSVSALTVTGVSAVCQQLLSCNYPIMAAALL